MLLVKLFIRLLLVILGTYLLMCLVFVLFDLQLPLMGGLKEDEKSHYSVGFCFFSLIFFWFSLLCIPPKEMQE